jgi:hypothetical protein
MGLPNGLEAHAASSSFFCVEFDTDDLALGVT